MVCICANTTRSDFIFHTQNLIYWSEDFSIKISKSLKLVEVSRYLNQSNESNRGSQAMGSRIFDFFDPLKTLVLCSVLRYDRIVQVLGTLWHLCSMAHIFSTYLYVAIGTRTRTILVYPTNKSILHMSVVLVLLRMAWLLS